MNEGGGLLKVSFLLENTTGEQSLSRLSAIPWGLGHSGKSAVLPVLAQKLRDLR